RPRTSTPLERIRSTSRRSDRRFARPRDGQGASPVRESRKGSTGEGSRLSGEAVQRPDASPAGVYRAAARTRSPSAQESRPHSALRVLADESFLRAIDRALRPLQKSGK